MRHFLLLFLFFSTTSLLQAQDKQWFSNAGLGGQFNTIRDGDIETSTERNQLYQIGIGRSKRIRERWSFSQEYRLQLTYLRAFQSGVLSFMGIGEQINTQFSGRNSAQTFQLEVPLYWQYHLNEQWSLTGGVVGSLNLALRFRSEYTITNLDGRDELNSSGLFDETENFNGAQIGKELGIVYQLNERLAVRLNAQQSVIDMYFGEDIGTALFAPYLVAGVNVNFGSQQVE